MRLSIEGRAALAWSTHLIEFGIVEETDAMVANSYPKGWALDAVNSDRFAALDVASSSASTAFAKLAELPLTTNARRAASALESLRVAIQALATRPPLDLA